VQQRLSHVPRLRDGDVSLVRVRVSARVQARLARDEPAEAATSNACGGDESRRLVSCRAGDRVVVGSIEGAGARVDKLASVGILPGVVLRVQQTRPVVVVESDETVLALEREMAAEVIVQDVS
jgi:Fe2+ transport system protein FeoA